MELAQVGVEDYGGVGRDTTGGEGVRSRWEEGMHLSGQFSGSLSKKSVDRTAGDIIK